MYAGRELQCDDLVIVSADKEGEEEVEWFGIKNRVKFQVLWKWLLERG